MKRIVVIGNSWTAIRAIREIKKQEDCQVTVFSAEGTNPYRRDKLLDCLAAGKIVPQLAALDEQDSAALSLTLNEKTIIRVNFRKKIVVTEDKEQTPYDVLIIADTESTKFPEIKGTHRNGVLSLQRKADLLAILKALPLTETIAIPAQGTYSLQLAHVFQKLGKEVILISATEPFSLGRGMDDAASRALVRSLDGAGVRMITNAQITEVLGDADVKAFRLSTTKVIAAQMIIFPQAGVELKLFKGTDLDFESGVAVTFLVKSNMDGVFAVDPAIQGPGYGDRSYLDFSAAQSEAITAVLAEEVVTVPEFLPRADINFGGDPIIFLGETWQSEAGGRSVLLKNEENVFAQVNLEDGMVRGGLFINRLQDALRADEMVKQGVLWPQTEWSGSGNEQLAASEPDSAGANDPVREPEPSDLSDDVPLI